MFSLKCFSEGATFVVVVVVMVVVVVSLLQRAAELYDLMYLSFADSKFHIDFSVHPKIY